jgi:hypothetical protein
MFRRLLAAVILLPTLPLSVCGQEPASQFFERRIRPVLISRCYGCHSEVSGKREGDLLLDRRDGLLQGGHRGPAIVPGDADASLLISAIRRTDPDLQMPPGMPLRPAEIADLERWISAGAFDPRDEATAHPEIEDPADPVAGRTHWAFQPLRRTRPPEPTSGQPASRIDQYVLSRLQAAGLQPVGTADRAVLARRLYFQLIGLPPSRQQLDAFVDDPRPDAYERLVDELLASPQFGERWGRHWLDLARYADSNGLDENFLFREAWRYRNWVIEAVNDDMPFDRFLMTQLAGDLLPYESVEQRDRQRIAAGFLVIGPKVLLGNNPEERRMDVADEQLDTIGRAVLGLTLGCARCHDHKFDPIPTADYYALAGIMTSTDVMQRRYMLGQQRLMERLIGLGDEGAVLNAKYEEYWRERPAVNSRRDQAKTALKLLQEDPAGLLTFAKNNPKAVAEDALDDQKPLHDRMQAQQALVAELDGVLSNPPPIPPRAMIPADVTKPADEPIRISGQFDDQGDVVPRGFLRVLGGAEMTIPPNTSGRLELARWLTDVEDGAGVLAARVLANRIWRHLIGRGIVRTVDNFGRSGEPPTHPALLDLLAQELIESGWSTKALIRQIVLSDTFRRSSQHDQFSNTIDPDNRLLWRADRRRLDPESLRDAMLSASGQLDLTPVDSTVSYLGDQATSVGDNKNRRRTDFLCRSVYLPVIRNDLPELFEVFDFADPHMAVGMRPQTMVAMQGLYFLNDASVMDLADATIQRLRSSDNADEGAALVDALFGALFSTSPTDAECRDVLDAHHDIVEQLSAAGTADADHEAWVIVCQALFASSRFQVLE